MPDLRSNCRSDSWLALRACLDYLQQGPWKFLLLRCGELDDGVIDSEDLDLLGSRASVSALLDAARGWVSAGYCHVRVKSTGSSKVGLHLISTDGKHRLDLDLWIDLWQIDNRKRYLTYRDCEAAVINPNESLQRLPACLEASIFIHHLVSKRKNISSPKQLARLGTYATACRNAGQEKLAVALESTAATTKVSKATADLTLTILDEHFTIAGLRPVKRLSHRLLGAVRGAWFLPLGKLRMLTIMGCDGCGKTTLSKLLGGRRDDIRGVYTGKHLYRKWIAYKLLVIFVRPILFQGREKFDDTFAPIAYLLACLRLRLKLLVCSNGILLIDRSIIDFLLVARKTDSPQFCSSRWLATFFGVRLPHIHFIVPFERLRERKLEMTQAGHGIYDTEMFRHFSRRTPTDYVFFDNRGSLEESSEALVRIIDWLKISC